jgi:hypothetical protein
MTSVRTRKGFIIIALIPLQNFIARNVQLDANLQQFISSPHFIPQFGGMWGYFFLTERH